MLIDDNDDAETKMSKAIGGIEIGCAMALLGLVIASLFAFGVL